MSAKFLLSTLKEFPNLKDPRGNLLPEIAVAGRSNVGKSSFINHFLSQPKLAKTSATPGKTQLLNFFLVDERYLFVDLPGYGFAKVPPDEILKWSQAIENYVETRATLKLLLLLIDSRREMSKEDLSLIEWAKNKKKPLLLILTKTDKLSFSEKEALLKKYPEAFYYTIMNPSSKHLIKKRIEEILWA